RRHTRSKRDWSSDVCSSDLGAVFMRLTTTLHTLHVARTFALDDVLELIPVQFTKVIVAAFFIPLQVWVFKAQAQSLDLRNNHVDETLTQLIIGKALNIPRHGLLGVRGICIWWAKHLQRGAVEAVDGFLCHLLLRLGTMSQFIQNFPALALVEGFFLTNAHHRA